MGITVARAHEKRKWGDAWLISAGSRGGACCWARRRWRFGHAQPKMTKERAEYQDEPRGGIMMCGTCTLFIPPAECKVVEGFVAVTGWCNAFDLAD